MYIYGYKAVKLKFVLKFKIYGETGEVFNFMRTLCHPTLLLFSVTQLFCYILRPDLTSKLVHGLTFGTPKLYIMPYNKINH